MIETSTININDNETVISELTNSDLKTTESYESKINFVNLQFQEKLNNLNFDELKEKCKENNITNYKKNSKNEVKSALITEFEKGWEILKNYSKDELKNICRDNKLSGISGVRKEELIYLIMNSSSLCDRKMFLFIKNQNDINNNSTGNILIETNNIDNINSKSEKKNKKCENDNSPNEINDIDSEIKRLTELKEQQQKKQEEEKMKMEEEQKQKIIAEEKKKKKQSIPKSVRTHVWNLYIGSHINEHRCICCKKTLIKNTDFEVGHVISEKDGGTLEITNLRPICAVCNHSMGTENMVEFVKKYGYYI